MFGNENYASGRIRTVRRKDAEDAVSLLKRRCWYIDLVQTAANVIAGANAIKETVKLGGTGVAGQPVYSDLADNGDHKTGQADAAGTDGIVGILLGGGADGQFAVIQKSGSINLGGTLVVGTVYVLSASAAGGIAPLVDITSNEFVTILGVATTAALLDLDIQVSSTAIP